MGIKFSDIKGLEIIYGYESLGFLEEVFIESANGKIAGILTNKKQFFSVSGIKFIKNNKVELANNKPGDINGKKWRGLQVETRSKKKLGKIRDLFFDENFLSLVSIEVKKRSLAFIYRKRIISVNLVFEVQDKKIIIIDDTQKESEFNLTPEISI